MKTIKGKFTIKINRDSDNVFIRNDYIALSNLVSIVDNFNWNTYKGIIKILLRNRK